MTIPTVDPSQSQGAGQGATPIRIWDVPGGTEQGFSFTYDSPGKTLATTQPQSPHLINGLKLLCLHHRWIMVPL